MCCIMRDFFCRLLLIAVLSMTAASIHAQIGQHRNDFAVGFNAGFVLSNVGFTPTVSQSFHGGVTAGVTARYGKRRFSTSTTSPSSIHRQTNKSNIAAPPTMCRFPSSPDWGGDVRKRACSSSSRQDRSSDCSSASRRRPISIQTTPISTNAPIRPWPSMTCWWKISSIMV